MKLLKTQNLKRLLFSIFAGTVALILSACGRDPLPEIEEALKAETNLDRRELLAEYAQIFRQERAKQPFDATRGLALSVVFDYPENVEYFIERGGKVNAECVKLLLAAVAKLEEIVATVKIPDKDFSIGKYEVTQKEYESVMGENPSSHKGADLPVENVSWNDAMDFCKKLTERERMLGRLPEGYEYTLPTFAQWEYACRAGTTTRFYTGDSEQDLDRAAWYDKNSGDKTHPVGQKEPNAFGLYDMHGNVCEWCLGRSSKDRSVYRGGCYCSPAVYCESSSIYRIDADRRYVDLGFRVALVPVAQ